jgi:hypothetical protein
MLHISGNNATSAPSAAAPAERQSLRAVCRAIAARRGELQQRDAQRRHAPTPRALAAANTARDASSAAAITGNAQRTHLRALETRGRKPIPKGLEDVMVAHRPTRPAAPATKTGRVDPT